MDPQFITFALMQYLSFLLSLSVHEAAHAAVADRCGDPTGRLLGRVTLNPIPHMDPIGTFVIPLMLMFWHVPYLFGWAKPVPFNPLNLKDMRRDPVFIALAGPASNILLALLFVLGCRLIGLFVDMETLPVAVMAFLISAIYINIILAVFNCIPVPPLDGHYVIYYFLPEGGKRAMEAIGPYGIIIAILIVNRTPFFGMVYKYLLLPIIHFSGLPII